MLHAHGRSHVVAVPRRPSSHLRRSHVDLAAHSACSPRQRPQEVTSTWRNAPGHRLLRPVPAARTAGPRATAIAANARLAGNAAPANGPARSPLARTGRPSPRRNAASSAVARGSAGGARDHRGMRRLAMPAHRRQLPLGVRGRLARAAPAAVGGDARRCAPSAARAARRGMGAALDHQEAADRPQHHAAAAPPGAPRPAANRPPADSTPPIS